MLGMSSFTLEFEGISSNIEATRVRVCAMLLWCLVYVNSS